MAYSIRLRDCYWKFIAETKRLISNSKLTSIMEVSMSMKQEQAMEGS